jgi:hypothetical protein
MKLLLQKGYCSGNVKLSFKHRRSVLYKGNKLMTSLRGGKDQILIQLSMGKKK